MNGSRSGIKHPSYIAYGSRALSRLECSTCNETTLHKYGKCIHCGAERAPPKLSGTGPRWNGRAR